MHTILFNSKQHHIPSAAIIHSYYIHIYESPLHTLKCVSGKEQGCPTDIPPTAWEELNCCLSGWLAWCPQPLWCSRNQQWTASPHALLPTTKFRVTAGDSNWQQEEKWGGGQANNDSGIHSLNSRAALTSCHPNIRSGSSHPQETPQTRSDPLGQVSWTALVQSTEQASDRTGGS